MALNFPANTSLPYVDPVSGLKYIYNSAIGAWEAAIQPPAVIADAPPALNIPGFLWWDNVSGTLYIWYQDVDGGQWVDATASGGVGLSTAYIGELAPENPILGELWWNSDDGRLYIYYDDGGSKQWIQATTGTNGETTVSYGISLKSGSGAPNGASLNDLWYNTTDKSLYLYIMRQGEQLPQWTKAIDVISPGSVVSNITAGTGISLTGTESKPVIGVRSADFVESGVIKIATTTETSAGTDKSVALTPGGLKESITSYLPTSSSTVSGVTSLATKAEVIAGTVADKSITPLTLKEALPDLVGGLAGQVIEYAGHQTPTGYLVCNGQAISRTTYPALFNVIGTKYGIGDGVTTFNLPTLAGNGGVIKCIKF